MQEDPMEKLEKFWLLVVDVWEKGLFGIQIDRLVIALAILLGFLIVRRLFTHIVIGRAKAWVAKSDGRLDNSILEALTNPIRFIPVVLGIFFATEYLALTGKLEFFATNTVRTLIVVTIFWAFFNAVGPLSFLLSKLESVFTRAMVDWLVKAIKGAILFIGAAAALEVWGIEIGPIIAGLGLFGVAVALGAQDLFKNLIAGILVLGEKRFLTGDWIRVEGIVEGTVEVIGFRSTRVRRFDQAPVHVPNAMLSDNAVTNFSAMTHRRIYWTIGVEYRTSIEQLRKIRDEIEHYILDNPAFVPPEEASTFVRVDGFNDSSIDLLLYCFTRTTKWGEWLKIKENLAYRIKEIVEGAGSGFAFPSRSLYIETLPAETPEIFVPPGQTVAAD
jgi:MscS family membrane protein